ncbi:MAG: type 2 isopentenyl-diphosphate Delta-isomerase [Bdellovibrionales bacterium]|nr:type 2 isopentenyl-diphosphate Delta-isomerase [Bdellovibrionales bacterium]
MDVAQFEVRKREHIDQALDLKNQADGLSGLDQVRLVHEALPEIDFSDVDLTESCLGQTLATPFFIAGMTMGHPDAAAINQLLVDLCQERGWAMGVGSQRRELEEKSLPEESKKLRRSAPRAVLIANIGLTQAIACGSDRIQSLVDSLEAQAIAVHLNPLQEAIQGEGTPEFRGGIKTLARLVRDLRVPIIVKETGCGLSAQTLERIASVGVSTVDLSGLGGTHWGRIEGARAPASSLQRTAAQTFARWGEPTVTSMISARHVLLNSESQRCSVWASGGVRSGLDSAKLIAIGAQRVGYAQPALQAALAGEESLRAWMEQQEFELRVALFCTGSANPAELRKKEGVWSYGRS